MPRRGWAILIAWAVLLIVAGWTLVGLIRRQRLVARECAVVADIAPTVATGLLVKDLTPSIVDPRASKNQGTLDCGSAFAGRKLRVVNAPTGPRQGDTSFSRPLFDDDSHAVLLAVHYGAYGESVEVERRAGRWVVTKRTTEVVS